VVHIRPDGAYGPGSQYRINTEMPFHVKTEFHKRNEEFIGYTVTLTQEGREVEMQTGDCSQYLRHMTSDIQQMVIVLSQWEGTHNELNWM
jgi:hypothetical protein